MKRSANLLILVLLLVVSALTAQYFRSSGGEKPQWAALRNDMQNSLNLLWGTPNNAVQLVPGEGGPQAYVTAFSPRGTRPSRQDWNFSFLRFVAARHPEVRLTGLFVTEGTTGAHLQELQVQQPLNVKNQSKPSAAYHPDFDEHSRAELLRRQYQTGFDQALGAGRMLVLVDVTMPAGGILRQEALEQNRRWPDPNLGRPQNFLAAPNSMPQPTVETWLVVNGDPTPVQQLGPKLGLTQFRLVPLAAL